MIFPADANQPNPSHVLNLHSNCRTHLALGALHQLEESVAVPVALFTLTLLSLSSLGLALADALVGDDLLVGGRNELGHADAAQGGPHLAGVDGVGNVLDLRGIQCADWYLRVCLKVRDF